MTPSDPPEEAPSALSRLERALAGFGGREAEPEPPDAHAEPEPEPEREPELSPEVAFEAETERDEEAESEWIAEPERDEHFDFPPIVGRSESSSVLDIASAVEAVERLSAAGEVVGQGFAPEDLQPSSSADIDERVFATAAAGIQAEDEDEDEDDDAPVFRPAQLRSRLAEYGEDEDGVEDKDEAVPFEVVDDDHPAPGRSKDAADSWNRNTGDPQLPYFLVEEGTPVVAEPVLTLEELRQRTTVVEKVKAEPREASIARTLAEIPILLIVAALIAFLVKTFLAQAYYIPSGSMLPQLQIDDRVVVSKLAYKAHEPRRGDIVVFDDPRPGAPVAADSGLLRKVGEGIGIVQPSTDEFIKRVIGLPGDKVSGHDGHVYINGHLLIEPYLKPDVVTSDFPSTKVGAGRLWVMGDNRSGSADSRVFGQIKIDTIVGRALVKVWPFDHISFL